MRYAVERAAGTIQQENSGMARKVNERFGEFLKAAHAHKGAACGRR
jgi:hypothetical protein